MKFFAFNVLALGCLAGFLSADPVAEGTYVDLIVVPIGPVALAEFEADTPPVPTEEEAKKTEALPPPKEGPGGGGGSGVRVKQQDPSEIPPSAVFVRLSDTKYYQVPCSLNAVSSPVRTPIRDSQVMIYQRQGDGGTSFKEVAKITVTQSGERLLILLTKPQGDKKWDDLKVSVFPLPRKERPQLFFVNGSQERQCGIKVGETPKALGPLKPLVWERPASNTAAGVNVILAMRSQKGAFLPPFFQSNVELKARTTSLFIPYGVSMQESFRGGKLATGIIDEENFRKASAYGLDK